MELRVGSARNVFAQAGQRGEGREVNQLVEGRFVLSALLATRAEQRCQHCACTVRATAMAGKGPNKSELERLQEAFFNFDGE